MKKSLRSWKRRLLGITGGLALAVLFVWLLYPVLLRRLAGASRWTALEPANSLSAAAQGLLEQLRSELGGAPLFDYHTHLAGIGRGSDCWVNPRMLSLWHPAEWIRLQFYVSAAGVDLRQDADLEYIERLAALVRASPLPVRHLLLAFDYRYNESGERDLKHSTFYVPNEHVLQACKRYPELFEACISVHPYRADALPQLQRLSAAGARFVKWLPSAMGIDPASPRCDAYYATLRELGLILLTHTGEEQAVEAEADQELSNPLRLRRALDQGVRVIAAHCASSGENEDLDAPGTYQSSLSLFLRLMDEPRYEGLLFGEISTITQINRYGSSLALLLERGDLHERLVHGSDWPLPGIHVLYSVEKLVEDGFLDPGLAPPLRELYDYHPLLFDIALKWAVCSPRTGSRFAPTVFQPAPGLAPP